VSRIAHLFTEVHMGFAHKGLGAILATATKGEPLGIGETAIFINRPLTGLKMLTADGTLLYIRRPKGINLGAVKYLPHCVEGKTLNYTKALEAELTRRLKPNEPRPQKPVVQASKRKK